VVVTYESACITSVIIVTLPRYAAACNDWRVERVTSWLYYACS